MNEATRAQAEATIIGWIDAGDTEEQITIAINGWYDYLVNDDIDGGANYEMMRCEFTEADWDKLMAEEKASDKKAAAMIELWTGDEGLSEALIGVGYIENDPFDNVHLLIDHSDGCPF